MCICIALCIGFLPVAQAQHQIGKYEKRWAMLHAFAALRVKTRLKTAMTIYNEVKNQKVLDSFESGGTLDAFRHGFTMAYLAQKIKVKKIRQLGKAHEKTNQYYFYKNILEFNDRADSLACEMDLRNNELGFKIGDTHRKVSLDTLKLLIINEIRLGNAWIMKRNVQKQYLTCQNEIIVMENYKDIWYIPKCLIQSTIP
ncbi:MAG: hypothetical protein IT237_11225 [Bacteroidia bacterium]|nr:hypothetical protein [Bacteroidia bacterium]